MGFSNDIQEALYGLNRPIEGPTLRLTPMSDIDATPTPDERNRFPVVVQLDFFTPEYFESITTRWKSSVQVDVERCTITGTIYVLNFRLAIGCLRWSHHLTTLRWREVRHEAGDAPPLILPAEFGFPDVEAFYHKTGIYACSQRSESSTTSTPSKHAADDSLSSQSVGRSDSDTM